MQGPVLSPAWPKRLARRSLLGGAFVLLAWLAGCASRPSSSDPSGATARPPAGVPAVVSRHPDRDGPPVNPSRDLLSAPAPEPRVEPIRVGGPNKPYTVLGQSYTPEREDLPFTERGLASWYGTRFHGRRTASGELYSVYGLTAAHRTLPIPSYARVTNPANGRSVVVRVNDRGPFLNSRIMDLSYTAAWKLGYADKGSGSGQGNPSARLRSTPYDAAIAGARKGRGNSMDTQMSSRPGGFGAQLQYRGEVGQYRRQMEDAIAREQVPRDYHNQIRDYFKSLQE